MCKLRNFMGRIGLPVGTKGYLALGVMAALGLAIFIAAVALVGGAVTSII